MSHLTYNLCIVCIGVSVSPQKHHPALSCQAPPLKSSNCPRHPFLGNLPYFLVERLPPSPQKSHSLRSEVLSTPPPFGKFGRRFNRPPSETRVVHTMLCVFKCSSLVLLYIFYDKKILCIVL